MGYGGPGVNGAVFFFEKEREARERGETENRLHSPFPPHVWAPYSRLDTGRMGPIQ